jgi:hypothetical protein
MALNVRKIFKFHPSHKWVANVIDVTMQEIFKYLLGQCNAHHQQELAVTERVKVMVYTEGFPSMRSII